MNMRKRLSHNFRIVIGIAMLFLLIANGAGSQTNAQDTSDILSYYRGFGNNPNVTETIDLLRAADNWSFDDVEPGFVDPISDPELLDVVDEWKFGLITTSPNITSFSPSSLEENVEGGTQIFKIIVDQHVNITWYINGTEVSNQSDVTKSIYINNTAAVGTWIVNVTASNNNGRISHEWIWVVGSPREPNSFELIEQARINGTIDNETALIYKVYVAFTDSRLPDQYRGNDSSGLSGTSIIEEAGAQYDNLSLQTQNILAPFFVPAYIIGSWHYLRTHPDNQSNSMLVASGTADSGSGGTSVAYNVPPGGSNTVEWEYIDSAEPPIRIWWQKRYAATDRDHALAIRDAITKKIHPSLFSLMKKEPISDLSVGVLMNGATSIDDPGAGNLDIALVDFNDPNDPDPDNIRKGIADGNTIAFFQVLHTPCQAPNPDFIQLSRNDLSDPKKLLAITTHEYMHAIIDSFKLKTGCFYPEYTWLQEATATWAEDYVYHDEINNEEHDYAHLLLDVPEISLNSRNSDHEYGAYLFPFYLHRVLGKPELIQAIWDKTENYKSLVAIDYSIPGGFIKQWPEFVKYNWNFEPYDNYQILDPNPPLTKGAATVGTPIGALNNRVEIVKLDGKPQIEFTMDTNVNYLAAKYYHFMIVDPDVRSVTFYNPSYLSQDADKTAFVKIAGMDWIEQNINSYSKSFCLDTPNGRVEELVFIFSNVYYYNFVPDNSEPAKLEANNIGCWGWKGSATTTRQLYLPIPGSESITMENIVFKEEYPGSGFNLQNGGSIQWSHNSEGHGCSYESNGKIGFSRGNAYGSLIVYPYTSYVAGKRRYELTGVVYAPAEFNGVCNGYPANFERTMTGLWGDVDTWSSNRYLKDDGTMIDELRETGQAYNSLITWNFRPLRKN